MYHFQESLLLEKSYVSMYLIFFTSSVLSVKIRAMYVDVRNDKEMKITSFIHLEKTHNTGQT